MEKNAIDMIIPTKSCFTSICAELIAPTHWLQALIAEK